MSSPTWSDGSPPDAPQSAAQAVQAVQTTANSANSAAGSASTAASAAQSSANSLSTNLYGSTTVPASSTPIQVQAVPDLTTASSSNVTGVPGIASTASGAQASAQGVADGVHQAVYGGSATGTPTDPGVVATNLTQIPQSSIVIDSSAGATAVTFDAAGAGAAVTGNNSKSLTITWNHTVAGNYLIVAVGWFSPAGSQIEYESSVVTYGSQTLNGLGGVYSANTNCMLSFFGISNPTPGTAQVSVTVSSGTQDIYLLTGSSSSYFGVGSVTRYQYDGVNNGDGSQSVASQPDAMIIQSFLDVVPGGGYSIALSGYNQTQRTNIAVAAAPSSPYVSSALILGDAPGSSTVTSFTATSSVHSTYQECLALALSLQTANPGTVGCGMRQYRVSTTAVSISGAYTAEKFPAGFFDSTSYITDSNLTANSNAITVSLAGWYAVTIRSVMAFTASAGIYTICPVVFCNGNAYQVGSPAAIVNGFGGNYATPSMCGTMIVYCHPGDVLEPGWGYEEGPGGLFSSGSFNGDSTGLHTYWSIALVNRSLL